MCIRPSLPLALVPLVPGYQSLMPPSFGQSLKLQQLADLGTFLLSGQKH
jgi:hypothetical protein